MAKRGSSGYSCVLGVDKPSGMSSHDVVNRVRTAFGEKRVGHFGTLDPLASGVLLVGVGPAARLDAFLVEHDKTYAACIVFGQRRNTDDGEGQIIAESPVPAEVADADFARQVLGEFTGPIAQVPPAFSAIKRGGVTAYTLARSGQDVELEPRRVEVHAAELLAVEPHSWTVRFAVSKGTYIRSLARDMGERVGCGAYLASLRRERVGTVGLDACNSLDDLAASPRLLDPVSLLGYPSATVAPSDAAVLANGGAIPLSRIKNVPDESLIPGSYLSMVWDNRLKALYRVDEAGGTARCACLFSVGVARG